MKDSVEHGWSGSSGAVDWSAAGEHTLKFQSQYLSILSFDTLICPYRRQCRCLRRFLRRADATLLQMDLVGSIRFYVDRMFENVRGMKSLILDRETVNTPGREGGGLEGWRGLTGCI